MNDNKKQAEKIKEISGANPLKCMKCGKCSASCPAFDEMDIKPHQFVSYVINENIDALVQSKSLWKCLSCFACVERCPRDVQPGRIIDAARQLVVRQRGQAYLSADEIPELLDPELPQQLLVKATFVWEYLLRLSGLRIQCCCELWCSSQMWLRS